MKNAISLTTVLGFAAVLYMSSPVSAQIPDQNKGGVGESSTVFAQAQDRGASKGCNANVTAVLNDVDNSNVPFQIQSDGQGAYTTYSAHKDSVASEILTDCSWTLDTTSSLSRSIAVTLTNPDLNGNGNLVPPFTGSQVVKPIINSHCSRNSANGGIDFGSMNSVGQKLICPINIAFYYNKVWYNIGINPYNWAGTTQTQVTCTGVSGGACNQWTVIPDPNTAVPNSAGQMSAIGQLTLPSCVGCTDGTPIALYEVSFSFLIHK